MPSDTERRVQTPPGVLVITADTDATTRQFRLRVRATRDVTSRRDEVMDTPDHELVLEFVGRWICEVRDAAVTARPHPPVTVIRPDLEREWEGE